MLDSGKTRPLRVGEDMFFVGFPDIGQNIVWKKIDSDPSLFLNYFHKAKSSMKTSTVLAR